MAGVFTNAVLHAFWRVAIALVCVAALMLTRHLAAVWSTPAHAHASAWTGWLWGTGGDVVYALVVALVLVFRFPVTFVRRATTKPKRPCAGNTARITNPAATSPRIARRPVPATQ